MKLSFKENVDKEKVEKIYQRLLHFAGDAKDNISADEEGATKADIKRFLNDGWMENEIVNHLKNMEHISPDLPEATALARMAATKAQVEARLMIRPVSKIKIRESSEIKEKVEKIYQRLLDSPAGALDNIDVDDEDYTKTEIERLLEREIVLLLRNLEIFSPNLPERKAIDNMAKIRAEVEARLKKN